MPGQANNPVASRPRPFTLIELLIVNRFPVFKTPFHRHEEALPPQTGDRAPTTGLREACKCDTKTWGVCRSSGSRQCSATRICMSGSPVGGPDAMRCAGHIAETGRGAAGLMFQRVLSVKTHSEHFIMSEES